MSLEGVAAKEGFRFLPSGTDDGTLKREKELIQGEEEEEEKSKKVCVVVVATESVYILILIRDRISCSIQSLSFQCTS